MSNENDLYYDDNEAIKFISKETGLDENTINTVLESEFRYMKSIGLVEDLLVEGITLTSYLKLV